MRYLGIYRAPEGRPPNQETFEKMGRLIEEMTTAGVLIATEGCLPSQHGARVRYSGGKFTVTDGPFTESKELVAGFALLEVKSREEAIEWTKRFLEVAGEGESEVRRIAGPDDFGPEFTPELREQEERSRTRMAAAQGA
ncbi:MAG TPA: YciI family protein [Gemmatimonadaceae bacterium]|nr:YciI family protein [Gemmatimonadaceae bacterium]